MASFFLGETMDAVKKNNGSVMMAPQESWATFLVSSI